MAVDLLDSTHQRIPLKACLDALQICKNTVRSMFFYVLDAGSTMPEVDDLAALCIACLTMQLAASGVIRPQTQYLRV